MDQLEKHIINEYSNDKKVYVNDLEHDYFGYEDEEELIIDIEFLNETILNDYEFIYNQDNPKYLKESRGNLQNIFKNKLFLKYGCCVISGTKSKLELQAAHIIPYCEDKKNIYNFSPSNGLLLKSNLHATFDGFQWSINPNNFCIEVKNKSIDDLGEINDYKNNEVKQLDKTDTKLKENLTNHYHKFINSF
jgi:hypothetical protein